MGGWHTFLSFIENQDETIESTRVFEMNWEMVLSFDMITVCNHAAMVKHHLSTNNNLKLNRWWVPKIFVSIPLFNYKVCHNLTISIVSKYWPLIHQFELQHVSHDPDTMPWAKPALVLEDSATQSLNASENRQIRNKYFFSSDLQSL